MVGKVAVGAQKQQLVTETSGFSSPTSSLGTHLVTVDKRDSGDDDEEERLHVCETRSLPPKTLTQVDCSEAQLEWIGQLVGTVQKTPRGKDWWRTIASMDWTR